MVNAFRKGLLASVIGLGLLAGNSHAALEIPGTSTYSGLTIFGDSLSDTGNVLSLTKAFGQPAFPSFTGAEGRFSNGPAWTEYLAAGLGFASSGAPSNLFYNPPGSIIPIPNVVNAIGVPGGQNFSYGGARTDRDGSAADGTGLLGQLVAWDNPASIVVGGPLNRQADPNALYVVMAGANDLRDIRSANFATDAASVQARANAATGIAQNVVNALSLLANAGARHFMISSLPDLGLTPEAVSLNQVAASSDVTLSFNSALSSLAGSFEATFNQANSVNLDIRTLDFYGLFNRVVDDATNNGGAVYGITNVTTACINKGPFSGEYFFADATGPACGVAAFSDPLHPSAKSHVLLGDLALQTALAPVPEPSEFAMLIAGLLVVVGMRRRAQAAV